MVCCLGDDVVAFLVQSDTLDTWANIICRGSLMSGQWVDGDGRASQKQSIGMWKEWLALCASQLTSSSMFSLHSLCSIRYSRMLMLPVGKRIACGIFHVTDALYMMIGCAFADGNNNTAGPTVMSSVMYSAAR